MKKISAILVATQLVLASVPALADTEIEQLKQQLERLKQDYEKRINALEKGLHAAQQAAQHNKQKLVEVQAQAEEAELASDETQTTSKNAFNPQISMILDGRFANYQNNPDNYNLPGYSLGNEAGLFSDGFSLGESELTLSSNIDQLFYGQITLAFADEDGSTEVGIEEAFE